MELLARLKLLKPDLPVVVLTAHGTIGSAVDAMKLGAFDYLTKPFTREQLRVVLNKSFDVAALKQENRRLREVVADRFSFEQHDRGVARHARRHRSRVARRRDRYDRSALRRERNRQRSCSPRRFTSTAPAVDIPSSSSTAQRFLKRFSSLSSSVIGADRSRAPRRTNRASSKRRIRARSSSTKLASCRC